jgi:hypothetical protein
MDDLTLEEIWLCRGNGLNDWFHLFLEWRVRIYIHPSKTLPSIEDLEAILIIKPVIRISINLESFAAIEKKMRYFSHWFVYGIKGLYHGPAHQKSWSRKGTT